MPRITIEIRETLAPWLMELADNSHIPVEEFVNNIIRDSVMHFLAGKMAGIRDGAEAAKDGIRAGIKDAFDNALGYALDESDAKKQ